jgi:hypothetical protein
MEKNIMRNYLVAFMLILLSSSCVQSKELTRSRALALIKNSKEFKEPATISLIKSKDIPVSAKSEDDPESEAQARAIELFYEDHPTMGVLQHLGLVEVKATLIKKPQKTEQKIPFARPIVKIEPWQFNVSTSLTDKGRELNQKAGGDKNEQSVVLYQKEVIEVTGITSSGDNRAQAEFTWRAVPTIVGEAFDTKSQTFQSLPLKLQQLVSGPRGVFQLSPLSSTLGKGYEEKKATAIFQRYDDGWRFVNPQ